MNLKSIAMTIATLSLVPIVSMAGSNPANPNVKITITGENAQELALALLTSGFEAQVKSGVRTLNVDNLVTVKGMAQHECDEIENAYCGFNLPESIQTAQQYGKNIELQEVVQLSETLSKVVGPALEAQNINNTDSGMGRTYSNYGKISCSWKVLDQSSFPIENANCTLEVPNYEY